MFQVPKTLLNRFEPGVWLCGIALALLLALTATLCLIILSRALPLFRPFPLTEFSRQNGAPILGVLAQTSFSHTDPSHRSPAPELQIYVANRDLSRDSFVWIPQSDITQQQRPIDAVVLERREYGPFFGRLKHLRTASQTIVAHDDAWKLLAQILEKPESLPASTHNASTPATAVLTDSSGRNVEVPATEILRAYRPNAMGLLETFQFFFLKATGYLTEDPRESNSEGGVLPALFGTFVMTLLMSIAVMPLGIVAALYLHEYAGHGAWVRFLRLFVANLAGVPSIVYGAFGLGFFVYFLGGNIDQLLFSHRLPNPTFGTGGILWASLTLALLTLPVVIVAIEQGLAAVPASAREASLALGATKFHTLCHVVLPSAAPSLLTGLILAMARGAGEVAPLMLTGVVKTAVHLPIDSEFPYLHPERKFMHLGFHILDAAFHSPNAEAAQPMIFASISLLLALVLSLNLAALFLRHRLQRRLQLAPLP